MAEEQPTIIHIDGASRGNPGPAAWAFVIAPPHRPVIEESERLPDTTNNVAEYTALLSALQRAAELGLSRLKIFSDSELLVKQMRGEYAVRNPGLRPLYEQARDLVKGFTEVTITHVRREQNRRADELCNRTLDGLPLQDARAMAATAATAAPLKELGPPQLPSDVSSLPSTPAVGKKTATAKRQKNTPSNEQVRRECIQCLTAVAQSWSTGSTRPTAEEVWDQLWRILTEHQVIKKPRS